MIKDSKKNYKKKKTFLSELEEDFDRSFVTDFSTGFFVSDQNSSQKTNEQEHTY